MLPGSIVPGETPMKALAAFLFSAALLCGTEAMAQSLPLLEREEVVPLVRDPEILIPNFNPETEVVLFRVFDFNLDAADIPFLVDRLGIVVSRLRVEEMVEVFLAEDRIAVFICSFPAGERPNILRPDVRSRVCSLRRH